jgi:hypothetical protein
VPAARRGERLWGRLRTGAERGRTFVALIYPRFANRPIESIKRLDIVRLLDDLAETHGLHRAQGVLASRGSPSIGTPAATSDDEIRAVWRAAEAFPRHYGYVVCFLALTATPQTVFLRSKNQSRPLP